MKNLMIWIHPNKDSDDESRVLIKIQIGNSYSLGWKEVQCPNKSALKKIIKKDPQVRVRIKKLNSSYNFLPFNVRRDYKAVIKPIRIVHSHPYKTEVRIGQKNGNNLFQWYCEQNKIKTRLLPKRVEKIFNQHEIKR